MYYNRCKEKEYSKQVTGKNADRLFMLSEELCGISYSRWVEKGLNGCIQKD